MAKQTEVEEIANVNVILAEAEDLPTFYANLCGVSTTPEEVIFTFAQRDLMDPTQANAVVRIYTSPGHAHRLVEVLTRVMENHKAATLKRFPKEIRDVVEKQAKSGKETKKARTHDE